MGMFDDIIVPKSYLKGLLTKEQEKLLKVSSRYGGSVKGVEFQTKSLDNCLLVYKIHRQKLYTNNKTFWNCEAPDTEQRNEDTSKKYPYEKGVWDRVIHDGLVNFYDSIENEEGDKYWVEFNFLFKNGVIDRKELVKFEICRSAQEKQKEDKEWEVTKSKRDLFQKTLKYKIFNFLQNVFFRFSNWAAKQTVTPKCEETEPVKRHLKKYDKARKTAKKKLPNKEV